MGVFGNRLSEQSEFSIDAHDDEQHRNKAVGGSLFFGYFWLRKSKVTRKSRESDLLNIKNEKMVTAQNQC
ncbi:MAG: hypothetical protein ABIP37_03890 [Methylotenera sp.]